MTDVQRGFPANIQALLVKQMNGETLFELVRAPAGVSLYMIDEDEPVAASSMSAGETLGDF